LIATIILKTIKYHQSGRQHYNIVKLKRELLDYKIENIEYNRNKYLFQHLDIQYHLLMNKKYPCKNCNTYKHHIP
jgi:hypothetical protein